MNAAQKQELAVLNAVGALDGTDAVEWRQLLANADPSAQAQLAQFNHVAALLAAALPVAERPSLALKDRIMQRVQASLAGEAAHNHPSAGERTQPPSFKFIRQNEGHWLQALPGVRLKVLSVEAARDYALVLADIAAGVHYPHHHHTIGEECYVLSGDLTIEGHVLRAGDFHHADAGSDHGEIFSESGCMALLLLPAKDYMNAV